MLKYKLRKIKCCFIKKQLFIKQYTLLLPLFYDLYFKGNIIKQYFNAKYDIISY